METVLVKTLLDKVREVTTSDYKTAKAMGVSPQTVSDWRAGRRPMPPEDIAIAANVAGMDPAEWLVRGVLEKHAGTKKGERLAIALGKTSVAIGAAIAGFSASAMERCSDVLRCIEVLSFWRSTSHHGALPHTPPQGLRRGPSRPSWVPVLFFKK